MSKTITATEEIWQALDDVMDPEIPVVSVVDLAVVRDVEMIEGSPVITITPTFVGCPALDVMKRDIASQVQSLGYEQVELRVRYDPPWSTDQLSSEAKEKLRGFGLAPPPQHGGRIELVLDQTAACPYCGSENTERKNSFGSTLCRSIHYCHACEQPFEAFKPL
ncbi:MAG: 1,2-phenylacetyl-CoA epoxidase subunit PaaD [Anaerolineales bacterium]